ncbi:hypothetical protein JAAARDRAFT_189150 [Jaapia argillacea MUCL 33604]|uniref:Cupin type-2 domain-containing protein n=1 Tax=Jaapia argillacea MUCL 33604 TaxID=933084 RepID=A0A067Q966_9AGAM|nr:hypothetical protein JAAARDRAFT_189150 [Jaapia argillacea MUCL 33604]
MTALPPPGLRRVVTGHDAQGKAVIQSDSGILAEPIAGMEGASAAPLWISKSVPTTDNNTSDDGALREGTEGIVVLKGTNLRYTDLAPGTVVPMHRTSSLDHNILVKGELVLMMEDGSETHLKDAGDVVIQRGTIHGWRNPSSTEWTRWVTVVIDAAPAVVNGRALEDVWVS